ncbi:ketoacyl-ACP synthase III [Streptomyces sp. TX20-6-3]|uniref:beta-ketoacyl-ACP synthase III n=1 Tax=Streptomyces sp. TX20-6-3 TaxID=3028705 RepID=UPI0029B0AE6D|nr:beta-ketoacyl-ACP synthase III [Streptomyces sp. TX20-6-3]MDX2565326.1 ketoacyl-ACP synthase III [Streptomyces sp. TX20-6-3]
MNGARLLSVGSYLPERVVRNEEICKLIDSSDTWIRERSGIASRHWASPSESVVRMAAAAAEDALRSGRCRPEEIGVVIVATVSSERRIPSAAAQVSRIIGATHAASFDLGAGCAGFMHAVSLAADMVRVGTVKHALIVGAEKLSAMLDKADRSTAFIFGDGAGAFLIGASDVDLFYPVAWGTDGERSEAIRTTEKGLIAMEGQQVFRWASVEVPKVALEALIRSGFSPCDLGGFVPHQANNRITDALVRRVGIPDDTPVARTIESHGNTSSASIPLALKDMLERGNVESGRPLLLAGFGAGLSYAAQVVCAP